MKKRELNRLKKLCQFEDSARQAGYKLIAGIDEVGRGPLAGPVVAAACILPEGLFLEGVDDSKKLTPEQRFNLYEKIASYPEIIFAVGIIDCFIIDQINILCAAFEAMLRAVAALTTKPDLVLVDGNSAPDFKIPIQTIIKGDSLSQSIAAASIIAKVTRDRMMMDYHKLWPDYGFDRHKGYSTQQHIAAIQNFGPCPLHRKTFQHFKA